MATPTYKFFTSGTFCRHIRNMKIPPRRMPRPISMNGMFTTTFCSVTIARSFATDSSSMRTLWEDGRRARLMTEICITLRLLPFHLVFRNLWTPDFQKILTSTESIGAKIQYLLWKMPVSKCAAWFKISTWYLVVNFRVHDLDSSNFKRFTLFGLVKLIKKVMVMIKNLEHPGCQGTLFLCSIRLHSVSHITQEQEVKMTPKYSVWIYKLCNTIHKILYGLLLSKVFQYIHSVAHSVSYKFKSLQITMALVLRLYSRSVDDRRLIATSKTEQQLSPRSF